MLVADELDNMRQPLDYLRRWPITKRNAILADDNAMRDPNKSILLRSKDFPPREKSSKKYNDDRVMKSDGSKDCSSSSSSSSGGSSSSSNIDRNCDDSDIDINFTSDVKKDSSNDSDYSSAELTRNSSCEMRRRRGRIVGPANFKTITDVCRANTLLWLKHVEDL